MRTSTLVLKNISRRKARALVSVVGLVMAVAVIVSTFSVTAAMQAQIGNEIDKYGPNIVVTPDSESVNVPYGSMIVGNVVLSEEYVERIFTIPNKANINVLSPKLYNQIEFENNSILVIGVFPSNELKLKPWWNVVGTLPGNDSYQVIVGSELERALNLRAGDVMQIGNASFTITATLKETGSVDDYAVFMPLHIAQSLFGLDGKITEIDVGALCNNCPVEKLASQIMNVVPNSKAIPIKGAVETRMSTVQQTSNFSLLLSAIILAVGIAGVVTTMTSAVHERKKEIGTLMSLGANNGHLFRMFISEAVLLGLIGGLVGLLAGLLSSVLIGNFVLNVPVGLADVPLFVIPLSIGLVVVASAGASLYPTWRASKIDPVKALKAI